MVTSSRLTVSHSIPAWLTPKCESPARSAHSPKLQTCGSHCLLSIPTEVHLAGAASHAPHIQKCTGLLSSQSFRTQPPTPADVNPPVQSLTITPTLHLLSARPAVGQKIPLALPSRYAPGPPTSQASDFTTTWGLSCISPSLMNPPPSNHPGSRNLFSG